MLFDNDFIAFNARGLFPGPDESQESFIQRAKACCEIFPTSHALNLTHVLFDAKPDWVEIKIDSQGLRFWEGAATWIEENAQGTKIASIQIKPSLPSFFYSKEEVVAHELVHAMRNSFEEKRFEEILAYRTSKSSFRRFFGPLFFKPAEAMGFIFITLFSWLIVWVEIAFETRLLGEFVIWIPFLILSAAIFRLVRAQSIFSKALRNLENVIEIPGKSLAVALRLTDAEINQFAKSKPDGIFLYAREAKQTSLRWLQLFTSYFQRKV